jgi:hypothetical protein
MISQSVQSTFFETFCTCSPSSLGQDPMVKIPNKDIFFPFLLLELEMADLSIFLEKNDLHLLGVKISKVCQN